MVPSSRSRGSSLQLSSEQFRSLRAELDALRSEYAAKIGDADAEYIRAVRVVARASRLAGRLLIHVSLEPVSWSAGVLALATYKVLENMEIGHNVLHGQYDFMRDPQLNSATYEWDMVGTAKSWKRAHNATHHVVTNVIGRDGDFGYKAFRFSDDVAWHPTHLLQPILSPLSGLFFQYSIGAYDLELLDRVLPKVLAANALANAIRNGWAYVVIYCGHLTERTATFREEELAGEDRAYWYVRQITGSASRSPAVPTSRSDDSVTC